MQERIIPADKSIVVAADVSSRQEFENLVRQTRDVDGIGGYKVGFALGLRYGLSEISRIVKDHSDKTIIYDHQKAGTDIPDTGREFADVMAETGIQAAILFPHSGPEVQEVWTKALQENNVGVLVGGNMTHKRYLNSEGGYIDDGAPMKIYQLGAEMNVGDFVVPGNKPAIVSRVRRFLEHELPPEDLDRLFFWGPGFVAQKGSIETTLQVAGPRFHAIVGRGIYKPKHGNIRAAALELTAKLKP